MQDATAVAGHHVSIAYRHSHSCCSYQLSTSLRVAFDVKPPPNSFHQVQHLFCNCRRNHKYAAIIYLRSNGHCGGEFFISAIASFRLESIDVAPRSIVFDRHSLRQASGRSLALAATHCFDYKLRVKSNIFSRMFGIRVDLTFACRSCSHDAHINL